MLHLRHHKAVAARLDAVIVTTEQAPRLQGSALREALARFSPSVTIELGPGERIIGGRVYYSAAWLGLAPGIEQAAPVVKDQIRQGLPLDQTWSPPRSLREDERHGLEHGE